MYAHIYMYTNVLIYNLASTCENLTLNLLYANNKGADQPVHPHSLFSTFAIRSLEYQNV